MDFPNEKILVTGNGLDSVNDVTLGGVSIPPTDISYVADHLEIAFSPTTALAVPGPGSYSLVVEGIEFSVYIKSAVSAPGSAVCPCQEEWAVYAGLPSPDGFSNVDPYCAIDTGDQVGVQFWDLPQLWMLTSEFNENAKVCSLVFDGATQTLNSAQEHEACATYLRSISVSATPCL